VAFSASENDRFQQGAMGIPATLEGCLLLNFTSYLNVQTGCFISFLKKRLRDLLADF
jgi:hypothetical protein